jgi:hypothetical protein
MTKLGPSLTDLSVTQVTGSISYTLVTRGDIALTHVGTAHQLADIFMKPLDEARFVALRGELGILDPKSLD